MKKLLFAVIFLLVASFSFADSTVIFEWDKNLEPDLAGYRLYQSTQSGVYTFGKDHAIKEIPAGTETVTITIPDGTYFWVMTAYDTGGQESGPSNELTKAFDSAPGCPKVFRFK